MYILKNKLNDYIIFSYKSVCISAKPIKINNKISNHKISILIKVLLCASVCLQWLMKFFAYRSLKI